MPRSLRTTVLAAALLSQPALAADPPSTTLSASAEVPVEQDRCLDHTVKELGMSAKKLETERRWTIGPQYLHSAIVKGGTLGLRLDKGEKVTVIRVTATWPGERKAADVQPEIEQRAVSMVTKMAQLCNVLHAAVTCTVSEPGGKTSACTPAP